MDFIIVGCGLTGAVIARELAEAGHNICIWERRSHIGGNMFDFTDEYGILVQKYGPHLFHTDDAKLLDYMSKYEEWKEQKMLCGATWNNKCTPTPFNFTTIDMYYSKEEADLLKRKLASAYPEGIATIVELLDSEDELIRDYAEYLFKMDYGPYTAKQWGIDPKEVDVSILKRVPVRTSYEEGYYNDKYQVMPVHSFTSFFRNLLNHPNIQVELNKEARDYITVNDEITLKDHSKKIIFIYTGPLDELFSYKFGKLPYRSLKFEWKHDDVEGIQKYPVVAYPQESKFTRITEFSKLPIQIGKGTTYAIEYPIPTDTDSEPYYPILTDQSKKTYEQYKELANTVKNLYYCGRLADFKYYDMDEALDCALNFSARIIKMMSDNND